MEAVRLNSVKFVYNGKDVRVPPRNDSYDVVWPEPTKEQETELSRKSSASTAAAFTQKNLITYSWENINVSVKEKNDGFSLTKMISGKKPIAKQILRDVSGIAKPGQLLAIMGASGSGKTTLLDVLNFRNKLSISGSIKINGETIRSAKPLSFISGYVTQNDLFIETLTVREHLIFHAMLRLNKSISYEDRMNRVETVLNDLNLKKCESTTIGNPEYNLKGISGGEKRRLAVATELLTNASLLMADEPTSGLDSFMAVAIIECLKNLARQGKTIICTIHQPSSDIYRMFDQLYLLAEGRVAFTGSLNEAADFFNSQQLYCPRSYNPADFYIQKLAVLPSKKGECLEVVHKICDNYKESRYYGSLESSLKDINTRGKSSVMLETKSDERYSTGSFTQIRYLFWRNYLNSKRNKISTYLRTINALIFAVMFGLIYLQQDSNKEESIRNINGVLYMCLMNTSFQTLFSTCATFSFEIPIVIKEHSNGMYRMINYFLSKIISEIPLNFFIPTAYLTIIYFMANLNQDIARFFIAVGVIVVVANVAVAFGALISAISPSATIAFKIAGAVMVPLNIFGGFYLNNRTVADYLLWLKYLSWIGYGNEALLTNQWDGVTNITCSANSTICRPEFGLTGDMVLTQLEMNKSNFNMDIGIMFAIYFIFRILTYLVLLYRVHRFK